MSSDLEGGKVPITPSEPSVPLRWFGWSLVSGFLFSPWNTSVWRLLLLLVLWQAIVCWLFSCWYLFIPFIIVSLIGWILGRIIFAPWLERSGWKARIDGMIPAIPFTSSQENPSPRVD
jgi:hypothetical protein